MTFCNIILVLFRQRIIHSYFTFYQTQETYKKKEALIKDLEGRVESLKSSKAEALRWSNRVHALEAEIERLKEENESLSQEKADLR